MKRDHMAIDGSDQMILVVLVAVLIGRIDDSSLALRAATRFLAAQTALAYLVAGAYKSVATYWQRGHAILLITRTRVFGERRMAALLERHSRASRGLTIAVYVWESCFVVALLAPRPAVYAILAIGLAFHAGCAVIMGLNTFIWAFAATYPAIISTNLWIREGIGGNTASIAAAATLAVVLLFVLASSRWVHLSSLPGGIVSRAASPPGAAKRSRRRVEQAPSPLTS